jgi:hypothetical protein
MRIVFTAQPLAERLGPMKLTISEEIFLKVFEQMQCAEEIGGPEGQEYLNLMERIKNDAAQRIENAIELFAEE